MYHRFFTYNKGALYWKERQPNEFKSKRAYSIHKSRYVGKKAGCVDSNGYVQIRLLGKIHLAHRVIWEMHNGKIARNIEIDHIDTNRSNNVLVNLRLASSSNNKWNMNRPSHNTSGFKGVSFYKKTGKWAAYIKKSGKKIHLGYFCTPDEAHKAYMNAAKLLFSEFARE